MVVGLILSYVVVVGVVALMLALWFFTGLIYWNRRKYAHIPSVPVLSFYSGHMKLMEAAMHNTDVNSDSSFDTVVYDMYKKTRSLVFCVHVFHLTVVYIHEPKAIKEIVLDQRNPKTAYAYNNFSYLFGTRFVGRGLLTEPDNDQWHKRRVILNNAFHRKFLKDFMEPFNASTDLFLAKLSEKADGKTVITMAEHFNRCALDVIAKVAFGLDLGVIESENSTFNRAVLTALKGFVKSSDMYFVMDFRNNKIKEEVRTAVRTVRETGRECLSKRIDEMNHGKDVPEDILTYIIKAAQEVDGDDKEKMEVMMDEFTLFFIAGQETTANLLSFTILALGRHPEVLKRLKKEVETVIGDEMYVTFEDISKLDYMTLVFKEALRLWPPASTTNRTLAHDINAAGYKIPVGTWCQSNLYTMARMEEYYHNAHDFDPERFRKNKDMTQYTYFPFAFGPRSCIGQHFAMIEARVILSKFLQRFQFKLVPGQKFTLSQDATSKPKEGCKVYLTDAQA